MAGKEVESVNTHEHQGGEKLGDICNCNAVQRKRLTTYEKGFNYRSKFLERMEVPRWFV